MTSAVAGICRLVAILILSAGMVKSSCATDGKDETHSVSQVPVSDAAVVPPLNDQLEVRAVQPSANCGLAATEHHNSSSRPRAAVSPFHAFDA
jgi:hypothetical protein